jgi:kinesin family protein 13
VDMREIYEEYSSQSADGSELDFCLNTPPSFFEPDQPHVLLGIANVFLQALFYDDVTLNYPVPVINQQGEIVGKLQVELAKISGQMDDTMVKNSSMQSSKADTSLYEEYEDEEEELSNESKTITVKVTVRHLAGVSGSHYVFCQYVFCDNVIVVPPASTTSVVRFDHTRYFQIPVSDEFSDYCSESALSIEVWGHRGNQVVPSTANSSESNQSSGENNNNSVTDRWKEVTSQMKLWVEIQVRF